MTQTVARERRAPSGIARSIVGGFFLCMGGVHIGIVATDATNYGPFAEGALFPFARAGWNDGVHGGARGAGPAGPPGLAAAIRSDGPHSGGTLIPGRRRVGTATLIR